jgi:hypothetical protein
MMNTLKAGSAVLIKTGNCHIGEVGYVEQIHDSQYDVVFENGKSRYYRENLEYLPFNDTDSFWERFDKDFSDRISYLESGVFVFEDEIQNGGEKIPSGKDYDYQKSLIRNFLFGGVCRECTEAKLELDGMYDVIYEQSKGTLKYTYRMGLDVSTGKMVVVQFILEPDKITKVGDIKLTRAMNNIHSAGKSDAEIQKLHDDAVSNVKKTIHKKGHIDHVTDALTVKAIFDSSKRGMQSVRMIPLISAINKIGLKIADDSGKVNTIEEFDAYIRTKEFQDAFAKAAKSSGTEIETYHVSKNDSDAEKQGAGKYKSTKIFWGISKFARLQFTPAVRGHRQPNRDATKPSEEEAAFQKYDGNNRPKWKK